MSDFFQEAPQLRNQYHDDVLLQRVLHHRLEESVKNEIEPHLISMGQHAASDLLTWSHLAETNQPEHVPYDAWGKRIDFIRTCKEWDAYKDFAAENGLIAIGYERRFGWQSRLYQMALLYLFHPSSAIFSCPLAMTDGAARAIELFGDQELKGTAYKHLTSWDSKEFWTSGQWMTEREGGSDVRQTATVAKPIDETTYQLHGTKWFTSATTSEMAMALAKIEGSAELSLFFLKLRDENGKLNHITVHRLKEKLGTKALPTAELSLQGTLATLVGGPGKGVKKISSLFNITRIYNSVCAVGYMRRALALAKNYATKRIVFGKPLNKQPLHLHTLSDLEVRFQACFLLTFYIVELLGKEETAEASEKEKLLLRMLTPIAKLFTAKEAVALCSEVLESFGGAGYVEDTHLPELLRNAQVLAIWEGTTNVLSLDLLRLVPDRSNFMTLTEEAKTLSQAVTLADLQTAKQQTLSSIQELNTWYEDFTSQPKAVQEHCARHLAKSLGYIFTSALLLRQAEWESKAYQDRVTLLAARRWCGSGLPKMVPPSVEELEISQQLGQERSF